MQAAEEHESMTLTQDLKLAKPALYDVLADLNLCGAVCYVRMRQYTQAKEAL